MFKIVILRNISERITDGSRVGSCKVILTFSPTQVIISNHLLFKSCACQTTLDGFRKAIRYLRPSIKSRKSIKFCLWKVQTDWWSESQRNTNWFPSSCSIKILYSHSSADGWIAVVAWKTLWCQKSYWK